MLSNVRAQVVLVEKQEVSNILSCSMERTIPCRLKLSFPVPALPVDFPVLLLKLVELAFGDEHPVMCRVVRVLHDNPVPLFVVPAYNPVSGQIQIDIVSRLLVFLLLLHCFSFLALYIQIM